MSQQDDQIPAIWDRAVRELQDSPDITPRQLAFVKLAVPLGLLDGTMLLAVGNDLTKEYLETRARVEITSALTEVLGREARFAITTDPDVAPVQTTDHTSRPPLTHGDTASTRTAEAHERSSSTGSNRNDSDQSGYPSRDHFPEERPRSPFSTQPVSNRRPAAEPIIR